MPVAFFCLPNGTCGSLFDRRMGTSGVNALMRPAARTLQLEGAVTLGFSLKPDGTIRASRVAKSSTYDILDKAALKDLINASLFSKAAGRSVQREPLRITIVFRLVNKPAFGPEKKVDRFGAKPGGAVTDVKHAFTIALIPKEKKMMYEKILFSTDGPIATLTLNHPKTINALSIQMIGELTDALTTAASDESVKVVVIKAAGKHFCAGHNLSEMVGSGVKEYKFIFDQCTRMMQFIHEMPQPVIAQVQGIATAAGCQLAAWCDLVVASEDARFSTPGVKIGLFCSTPMVAVSRAIGRKMAMEMLLTGREFPASEAKELGLVNRVVPLEDLESETTALAQKISEASRFALSVGKQGFYAQIDQTDDKAFHFAKHTIVMNNLSEDAQSGIRGFLEKKGGVEWKDR